MRSDTIRQIMTQLFARMQASIPSQQTLNSHTVIAAFSLPSGNTGFCVYFRCGVLQSLFCGLCDLRWKLREQIRLDPLP